MIYIAIGVIVLDSYAIAALWLDNKRLNTALLRVERPQAAAQVERSVREEPTQEERKVAADALSVRQAHRAR